MKRLTQLLLALTICAGLCLGITLASQAAEVTLAWDVPTGEGAEDWSTRIYIGTVDGVYTHSHDAGNPERVDGVQQTVVENLVPGVTYYFVARHYAGDDESGDSNMVSRAVPVEKRGVLPPLPELPPIDGYKVGGFLVVPDS